MRPADRVLAGVEGLQVFDATGPSLLMRWEEVFAVSFSRVDVKTDILTYLTFDYDHGEFVETHSDMEGFAQLVADLPGHLSMVSPRWQEAMQAAMPGKTKVVCQRSTA